MFHVVALRDWELLYDETTIDETVYDNNRPNVWIFSYAIYSLIVLLLGVAANVVCRRLNSQFHRREMLTFVRVHIYFQNENIILSIDYNRNAKPTNRTNHCHLNIYHKKTIIWSPLSLEPNDELSMPETDDWQIQVLWMSCSRLIDSRTRCV